MKINKERLMKNLAALEDIGKTPSGGRTRIAGSKAYFDGASIVMEQMKNAGLSVRMDSLGSVFGRRKGQDDSLPAIMIGSHMDTVTDGGLYDGALGVYSGLECVEAMNDFGVTTTHPIELVGFNHEEGNELGGTFGSRAMMGSEDIYAAEVLQKLESFGLSREYVQKCKRSPKEIRAFFELHIEQGGVLDGENISIGVVDGIVGIVRYEITVRGEANHAGTTPMGARRDALFGASRLISKMWDLCKRYPDPFVFTVGKLSVFPGSVNVVPGEVRMILEIRDLSQGNMESFADALIACSKELSPFEISFARIIDKPSVRMDPALMRIIAESCRDSGIACRNISSGAGHDAKVMARCVPSAMIFVPSKNGISHSPKEFTEEEHIGKAAQVLLESVMRADKFFTNFSDSAESL